MGQNDALAGQVVIVTGAGQGIGRAEALEFAQHGARVVLNDVVADQADAVVDEIKAFGGEAIASHDSVATSEGGRSIVDRTIRVFGRVDALVNNAGFLRPGAFEDLSVRDIEDIIDVHLKGAFFVTQPAWKAMKTQQYGRIVMTGSSAGMFSQGSNSNYCAAKAGVFGLARALAFEGEEYGIKVNVVLPFAATTISKVNPIPGADEQRRRRGALYEGRIAGRRDAQTVAPLVAVLGSPGCRVTGEVFSACAGRYARVFVGVGKGWLAADAAEVTTEMVVDSFDEIRATDTFIEPRTMFDEVAEVINALDNLPAAASKTTGAS